MIAAIGTTTTLIGALAFRQGSFFLPADYRRFKSSLFQDLNLVQELRKERNAMSATRRIYAVYGALGTGMLYR